MERAPRISFTSLGCPKALVDSERIITRLRAEGYELARKHDGADIVIVNTGGFLDSAKQESLAAIGEAMAENGKVIVTGCMGAEPEAIEQAYEVGLDLVEVSPNADPPVCKFLDIGKYKYEAQKKANIARKTQRTQEIKEIKMRPNIDDHDYDTKMKKVHDFIGEGDKVKITLRFRGRELSHQQLGMNLLQRVAENVAEIAKVEAYPRMEGRQMLMVLAPK